jgi:hypothetical protein
MEQIKKRSFIALVILVVVSFAAAGFYYRQGKQLKSVMITVSGDIVGEDIFISISSIHSALYSSIRSQELEYRNNKQIMDRSLILSNQFEYLKQLDPEHRDEWRELQFMSRELWSMFNELEQKILPDDSIELDEEQTLLLTEIYDNLEIVSELTYIEFPSFDAQSLELDESTMTQSLEASNNLLALVEEGFVIFNLG